MAGMEQLEIHSKSYLVRWVNVKSEHTISWTVKPERKSINFGIFKHPGFEHGLTSKPLSSTFEAPPTPGLKPEDLSREGNATKSAQSTATEKLKSFGLKPILWHGICEANRVSTGQYDVPQNEGGMYALVFDNTYSKQLSKRATFVLLTYPTNSPPQSNHHKYHVEALTSESLGSLKDAYGQRTDPLHQGSSESVRKVTSPGSDKHQRTDASKGKQQEDTEASAGSHFYTGMLKKRRRKKGQGWAPRFFSIEYATSTLSYYHDRNTLNLRGSVPLSLAAIGANAKTRQISIDSGAEIWHLKASNQKDFEAWKQALELAQTPKDLSSPGTPLRSASHARQLSRVATNPEEEREWSRLEGLRDRIIGSRDATMAIAKDTDPKYLPLSAIKPVSLESTDSVAVSATSSNAESPPEAAFNGYFNGQGGSERRPFWKRKPSSERPMPGTFRRSVSATPATTPQRSVPATPAATTSFGTGLQSHPEEGVHDQCMTLLRDLDAIIVDFADVLDQRRQRRTSAFPTVISRQSIDSQGSDEFFDAEGYSNSQLLAIHHESDDECEEAEHSSGEEDRGSASEYDEPSSIKKPKSAPGKRNELFPLKPKSLSPLPADKVQRRSNVAPSTMQPPSLIGFFRKNVGKDLSTISTPVSANEPTSLLQRVAECLEYSQLLDAAASAKDATERLLYISAFAISMLSAGRVKERSVRKPFNPMLGETFELVREDRGFRFLAEKISHRPVRMACQAESEKWSMTQAPLPTQKFWGKSAEIVTEGKFRIALHTTGEHYCWNPATAFLRNIIAGEKYVEPVGTMTIINPSTGERAVVTFKSKGMFAGRSEEAVVQLYDSHGEEQALGLSGKWTSSLNVTEDGSARGDARPIWTAGDLVPDAVKRYGFTTFAATLNEITALEEGKIAPTDSRLRPDQRAAEDGNMDRAENAKVKLEEAQRARRKAMEEKGEEWQPRWFRRVEDGETDGEEAWVAKGDRDGYWERRKTGNWGDVENWFQV